MHKSKYTQNPATQKYAAVIRRYDNKKIIIKIKEIDQKK